MAISMLATTAHSPKFDAKDAFIAHLSPTGFRAKKNKPLSKALQVKPRLLGAAELPIFWGRRFQSTWTASLFSISIMSLAPCLVIFFWITMEWFDGSVLDATFNFLSQDKINFVVLYCPRFSLPGFAAYITWFSFQAVLFSCLPGPVGTGQLTPAGHQLQ